MTSAGTNASLSMHFFLSWSVLVCFSVGSGRPLGPVQKAPLAVVKSSQVKLTARLQCFSNRGLVETNLGASKTLYLKAFQSLENCLDKSTITKARFVGVPQTGV